jgi:GTP-binding protein EngB required for normal cell division
MSNADGILKCVKAVAADLKLGNLQPLISACRNQLDARGGIDVAVFGRFKAGKSSFLNHLGGCAVLPIGVVPLTAVITRLRYGEHEHAEVQFLDGTAKTISFHEISLYAGQNENPNNRRQVASVEVELPELKPLAPLQFVDTPGLGSAFTHNTEVALNWLPNVGTALVAVSADAPLSERDLALLAELRNHTPKIALLLTKADLLTEPQRVEVLRFVREQLGQAEGGHLPVFFYSIQPELAAMKSALLDGLLLPLRQRWGEASRQILRHKMASLREQTLNCLRVALAAATQAESVREALRDRLEEERRQFGLFRLELEVLTRQWSAKAFEQSLARLHPAQRTLQGKITGDLQAQFPQWRLRLPQFIQAWREWVQTFLLRELSAVSHTQRAMFCEPVQRVGVHLTRSVRAFHDRLAEQVQAALGVGLSRCEFNLEVREPSEPPLEVSYAFDVAFSAASHFMPAAVFRRPIERMLLRKARWEVEKNLSRLAAAWSEHVKVVIEELRQQTEKAAQNELDSLARMAEQAVSDVPRLREQIVELEDMSFEQTSATTLKTKNASNHMNTTKPRPPA